MTNEINEKFLSLLENTAWDGTIEITNGDFRYIEKTLYELLDNKIIDGYEIDYNENLYHPRIKIYCNSYSLKYDSME